MFCFLFCSFFIMRVFLSHNVIWKQFLPTAGFAFTIGKHVKWKAKEDVGTHRGAFPPPLGSRSEAYLGSLHKPHQNRECLQTGDPHSFPPSEGQHVLWGRNFLNILQIKLIRCRPDCQLPRSACHMWRPGKQRLPRVTTTMVQSEPLRPRGGLPGRAVPSRAAATKAHKDRRQDKSPKSTQWSSSSG